MGARYITTDLILEGGFDFQSLHKEIEQSDLIAQWHQRGECWLANHGIGPQINDPNEGIEFLLDIIEGLSGPGRETWNRLSSRRFDMGFQGEPTHFSREWEVRSDTLARIVAFQGSLVVTIYRPGKKSSIRT